MPDFSSAEKMYEIMMAEAIPKPCKRGYFVRDKRKGTNGAKFVVVFADFFADSRLS